ncbi:MAG: hypothetical protein ACK480_06890 [Planctomycetota bacterium]
MTTLTVSTSRVNNANCQSRRFRQSRQHSQSCHHRPRPDATASRRTLGESTCISGRLGGPLMRAPGINPINAVPPHRLESIRGDD